jgi:outer membrane protein assembly factor BamB
VALFDLDGDGKDEVFIGSTMTRIFYCLSGDGTVRWQFRTTDRGILDSACAIADVTGDTAPDVVFGTSSGMLYVLDAMKGTLHWNRDFEGQLQCEPVLVDLDGDGALEIVVITNAGDKHIYAVSGRNGKTHWALETGRFYQYHNVSCGDLTGDGEIDLAVAASERILLLTRSGKLQWEFTAPVQVMSPTSMGDVDGDGRLELVFVDGAGTCTALKSVGGRPEVLWQTGTLAKDTVVSVRQWDAFRGPVLADVSGDGELDVLFCTQHDRRLHVLSGKDGRQVWAFQPRGPSGDERPHTPNTCPVVADLDGDGTVEVFFVAGSTGHPGTFGRGFTLKTKGKGPPWKTFRRDLLHHGCVPIGKKEEDEEDF